MKLRDGGIGDEGRNGRAAAGGTELDHSFASGKSSTYDAGEDMASQQRNMEGDNEQRRAKAKKARDAGKLPSEEGATLGASKQRREAKQDATHQEKLETRGKGKRDAGTSGKPRPGNRETDPKRTDRWG